MKGGPARSMFVLAFAAAASHLAAAAERFVPTDPRFVVAHVAQAAPDAELRERIARWRAAPDDAAGVQLARGLLDRARALREPMFYGRAEAVLAAALRRADASAETRRLYAATLQYRHDFTAAQALLDGILARSPFDAAARTQRASVRLVRGDFDGARADCAQLLAGGGNHPVAVACLAESLAGIGRIAQARALLAAYPLPAGSEPAARAYFLTTRAELAERDGSLDGAIADYSVALQLAPHDDAVRAALADALLARGEAQDADAILAIERPSLALLVRRVECAPAARRTALRRQADAWLRLETARGDAPHEREAALLALATGDPAGALAAAQRNFHVQRELADVRVLARAAVAAGDAAARRDLESWLRATGYRDVVTEDILRAPTRG
ncbi:MAG TPA: tetratricopeptide repeat protein [Steroidobacteraceae bacterium]|nr:tetratricopeptide repeat protein [Steroidobacteraceae bacterium]